MVDGVMLEVEVADDVPLPVGVTDAVALALIVDDGVIVGVKVALNDVEGVPLAEPPVLIELDDVAVIVEDKLATIEPLSLPVLVPDGVELEVLEPVPDDELVGLFDGEFEGVEVADNESLDVMVALCDTEDVPLAEPP